MANTYRYRDQAKRKEYQRVLMAKRRAAVKKGACSTIDRPEIASHSAPQEAGFSETPPKSSKTEKIAKVKVMIEKKQAEPEYHQLRAYPKDKQVSGDYNRI